MVKDKKRMETEGLPELDTLIGGLSHTGPFMLHESRHSIEGIPSHT